MDIDICFGDPKNRGVIHLRTVTKRELQNDKNLEFGPSVLASIKRRLAGRGFFVSDGAGGWRRSTLAETNGEIEKIFHMEKGKEKVQRKSTGNR